MLAYARYILPAIGRAIRAGGGFVNMTLALPEESQAQRNPVEAGSGGNGNQCH